jgi:hypothetical protein
MLNVFDCHTFLKEIALTGDWRKRLASSIRASRHPGERAKGWTHASQAIYWEENR